MITGPHSFTDATGVEWHIEGYSRTCGAAYVDCRTADGKALTVRPVAYLAPAGLSIPEGAPPPKKRATAAEKRAAAKEAERYATPVPLAAFKSMDDPEVQEQMRADAEVGEILRAVEDAAVVAAEASAEGMQTSVSALSDLPSAVVSRVVHCKQEPFDVYIGRPGPWGNPYTHREGTTAQHVVGSVEEAIDYYRQWLRERVKASEPGLIESLANLHGKTLGCYCAPGPCHGDVIAEAAAWAATQV